MMDPMDFSTGTTNLETFPTEELAEAAAQAVREHGVELNKPSPRFLPFSLPPKAYFHGRALHS